MAESDRRRTTITLNRSTKEKFDRAKPYDTLTADEFLDVLLDRWEARR
jgi:DNA-binding MarR family transcriptional regulator